MITTFPFNPLFLNVGIIFFGSLSHNKIAAIIVDGVVKSSIYGVVVSFQTLGIPYV